MKCVCVCNPLFEQWGSYLGPWIIIARSLVIFPDSTTPTQAASSFSVNSNSLALLSNFALEHEFGYTSNDSPEAGMSYKYLEIIRSRNWRSDNNIPVCKSSGPCKDRGYAVCAGFTAFLVNPEMSCNRTMGCFSFYGLSVRTYLNSNTKVTFCLLRERERELSGN